MWARVLESLPDINVDKTSVTSQVNNILSQENMIRRMQFSDKFISERGFGVTAEPLLEVSILSAALNGLVYLLMTMVFQEKISRNYLAHGLKTI